MRQAHWHKNKKESRAAKISNLLLKTKVQIYSITFRYKKYFLHFLKEIKPKASITGLSRSSNKVLGSLPLPSFGQDSWKVGWVRALVPGHLYRWLVDTTCLSQEVTLEPTAIWLWCLLTSEMLFTMVLARQHRHQSTHSYYSIQNSAFSSPASRSAQQFPQIKMCAGRDLNLGTYPIRGGCVSLLGQTTFI